MKSNSNILWFNALVLATLLGVSMFLFAKGAFVLYEWNGTKTQRAVVMVEALTIPMAFSEIAAGRLDDLVLLNEKESADENAAVKKEIWAAAVDKVINSHAFAEAAAASRKAKLTNAEFGFDEAKFKKALSEPVGDKATERNFRRSTMLISSEAAIANITSSNKAGQAFFLGEASKMLGLLLAFISLIAYDAANPDPADAIE